MNILDEIFPEAGAFYVLDRGYIDFERLYGLTLRSAFFVVRTKSNVLPQCCYSHAVDKATGNTLAMYSVNFVPVWRVHLGTATTPPVPPTAASAAT